MQWTKILKIGVRKDQARYIQEKVLLTNQIAVIIGLLVAVPFIVISLIHFKPLAIYPAFGVLVCGLVIVLNYYKINTISRIIMSIAPFFLATIYNGYLTQPGDSPLMTVGTIQLSFMLVPFLVIDLREKLLLATVLLPLIGWFVFMNDWANAYFHIDLDNGVIKEGYLFYTSLLISVLTAAACMLTVLVQKMKSDEKNNELMEDMEGNAKQLKQSEDKLRAQIEQIELTKKEDKKRNWVTEGLANFGEILRSNQDDTQTLCNEIISKIVKYLKANQGSLFVLNDENKEDPHMQLQACYAWDRKKFVEKRINKGQGLLGQSWIEADTIYMTDVPQNYIAITSGLGQAMPSALLIVPLLVNEEIFGMIEIASFNEFEDYQIDFVEKVGESIASTLSSSKINERTKVLLEQSQQQAEEMRAQEEEIRQNMEEMQATQEEMNRKQLDLNGKMTAINSSNALVEFEPGGQIIAANDLFLKCMGYNLEEIQGKHHSIFVDSKESASEEYKRFWDKLDSGQSFTGEFKRKSKNGSDVWLSASYTPIIDSSGSVIKVIKLAQDTTGEKLRNTNFENQINAIHLSQGVIEFDLRGHIQNANEVFLDLMGYNIKEIKGKHHSIFCEPDYVNSADYKAFWKKLAKGEFDQGEFKRIKKGGSKVLLKATYTPILDAAGKPYKIIKFASEINVFAEKS
ncbi:MAG: PAS domain-containing protein [Fulvivirga sp.]